MRGVPKLPRRFEWPWRGRKEIAREVDEEIGFHLEMRADELVRAGVPEAEARARAEREFGDVEAARGAMRAADERVERRRRRADWMDTLRSDLRFALRTMRRNPGFTVIAALTIALGIGATTSIFSVVNAVLLRPLPVADPAGLLEVRERVEGHSARALTYPRFAAYREGSDRIFSALAAQGVGSLALRTGGGAAEPAFTVYGSGNYFDVLGIRPAAGRLFVAEDDRHGAPAAVAVISHRLWRTRFGADPAAVGRTLHLNGQPVRVIGVAPQGFGGTFVGVAADVWVPIGLQSVLLPGMDNDAPGVHYWLTAFGRLRPEISRRQAEAAVGVLARQLGPERAGGRAATARLEPLTGVPSHLRGATIGFMAMLLATAGLVLLIASANVGGMMLARATARQREIAIRMAVGAERRQLVRQLVTESVVLFLLGSAGGLLLALAITRGMLMLELPISVSLSLDLGLDARVMGFTLAVALGTGILFGLAPALQSSRPRLLPALKEGAPHRGSSRLRLRSAFVIAQLAMSLLLLVSAGLFIRALQGSLAADPGFDPDGVALTQYAVGQHRPEETRAAFHRSLRERVAAMPGVESVGLADFAPLSNNVSRSTIEVPGDGAPEGATLDAADYTAADAGYFETLRIPIVQGRPFQPGDLPGSAPVVIVNQEMARVLWPGENPVGKPLRVGSVVREVVGVARTAKYHSVREEPRPFMYLPFEQAGNDHASLLVRVRAPLQEGAVLESIRREITALDPDVLVQESLPLPAMIGLSLLPQRIAAVLIGAFGAVGLLLASLGVYGVLAYHVGQRTREIGVRIALGARSGDVVRMVLRRALGLVGGGVALGLAAAFAATRLLSGFLAGVSPTDPVAFGVVPLSLAAVALLASYLPARRAASVSPMTALRE